MIDRLTAALSDRYRIERELGEGGMATVYLAEDVKHDRRVALKVLKPELAAVVGAERFLAEIKTTANLHHPNILPLFDSGEADGLLFYVMPYIEGETLRERVQRERQLPVEEAVRITTAVSQALQHAHERGIVHRDIKPANILLQDGQPVVADFGIALAVGAAGGSRLTETGLSVGTPYYMSPEQATGDQEVGPRSDVYALAAVLYEMLTGEPPYTGTTAQAVLGRILQGKPVSATEIRASVPPNVDATVRKALEKLPADRFADAAGFARALGDPSFRHGVGVGLAGGIGAASAGPWKPLSLGLAAALVATLAWAGWATVGGGAPDGVLRQRVILWDAANAVGTSTTMTGMVGDMAAIAPDGSSIVFPEVSLGAVRLVRKQRDQAVAVPLSGGDGGLSPAFSPDGEWIVFGTIDGELRKVRSTGGGSVRLVDGAAGGFASPYWLDNDWIYYIDTGFDIRRVRGDGTDDELVLPIGDRMGLLAATIFPIDGGRALLFSGCTGNCNQSSVFLYDVEEDETQLLFENAYGASLLPTGHLVYVSQSEGAANAAPFDIGSLEVTGGSITLIDQIAPNGLTFNRRGDALYALGGSGAQNELVWVTRSGGATPVDPGWSGSFSYPAISPDGSRLAVGVAGGGDEQVWIKTLDDGPIEKLTSEGLTSFRPEWTPDGTSISYVVGGDDLSRDLYGRRADGSDAATVQLDVEDGVWEADYSRDGRWLVYRLDRGNLGDLYALDLTTDETVPLLVTDEYSERQVALSPDGRWLAYIGDRSGRMEVYVRPFPNAGDGRTVITSDGGSEPVWSPDGRELFFREAGSMKSIEVLPGETFRTGEVRTLFPDQQFIRAENRRQYDISPDGERFVMIRASGGVDTQLVYMENWLVELEELLGR
jgi:serine/threonine-protein kinase